MKKLLSLLLAALMLLSAPLSLARAEGEAADEPEAKAQTDDPPTAQPTAKPHNKPRWKKSLQYWEEQRESLALTGNLREDVLLVAQSQIGYSADSRCYEEKSGKKRYYTRYGDWYGSKFCDWCDVFVSFCVYYGGNKSYPSESSCARHMYALKRSGYWREWNSYVPKKGDLVFFAPDKDRGTPNHVGIVEEVIPGKDGKAGKLVTIEGNQRNPKGKTACVRRMNRTVGTVLGYGVYEKGKTYPEANTRRSNGWVVIDETSIYFVERPTEAAMKFLGLVDTPYYAHWFPPEPPTQTPEPSAEAASMEAEWADPASEATPEPATETAGPEATPEPEALPKAD